MKKVENKFDKVEYDKEYHKEHYYRMNIVMPKEKRARIEEAAARAGRSKNAFINDAIDDWINKFL